MSLKLPIASLSRLDSALSEIMFPCPINDYFFIFLYFVKTCQIREEDEEIEAEGANYQLEMMRCLREVNVDNNTVGW